MKYVGITGSSGFLGSHLKNTLCLEKEKYSVIDLNKEVFNNLESLIELVKSCDIIFHFAAVIRSENQDYVYKENIRIADCLIKALEKSKRSTKLIFSSSIQEGIPTPYGKAKREIRSIFENWANKTHNKYTTLIIPNLFGPFAKPYYNSFIATFSHEIINGLSPKIYSDNLVPLLYVDDLVKNMISLIFQNNLKKYFIVSATADVLVSDILKELLYFRDEYIIKGAIPKLDNKFSVQLFNTFRSHISYSNFFPRVYQNHEDNRGNFIELVRVDTGGQISFSTTMPGVTRGNHFHTRKIERFSVIHGKAKIEMSKYGSSDVMTFHLDGASPSYVDIPIWHYHNLTNLGTEPLFTIFWINECFDPKDSDTYF